MNTLLGGGPYYVTGVNGGTIVNSPIPNALFLYVLPADESHDRVLQIATRTNNAASNGKILWYRKYVDNGWSDWVPLATATPPEEHDLQLAAGITTYTRSKYFKSQDNVVTFYATVQKEAGFSNGALIATLPVGFRPSERIDFPATFSSNKDDGVRAPGFAMLNPNGKIQSAANGTGLNNAYIYGSFVAAD